MTYEQALDYIHTRIHRGTRQGMPRMRLLMEKLGNPQKRLKIIHVAGSNGKGSTCTMLESVLRQAGYRTGLFISPYVFDFRERIQLCGELVDKQLMADTLETMLPVFQEMKALDQECTEFETLTALAFVIFAQAGVDFAVIEVGIGGLLDCTNVIDPPVLAVIGAISLEHTEILGNTIPEIAAQKCGIIKAGCRVAAYCGLHPEARAVLEDTCASLGITPRLADPAALEVLSERDRGSCFRYAGEEYFVPLAGKHQVYNALTVLSATAELREAGFDLPEEAVQKGLAATRFVGRLQIVRDKPKCLLDGAHNPGKLKALAQALEELYPGKPLICVMGIMRRKDYHAAIPFMAGRSRVFIAVPAEDFSGESLPPEEMAHLAARFCDDVRVCASAEEGARLALRLAHENDVVVACGSMYLLGDAKKGFALD
ncbi:MAG: bifunctional folylpolyglutamate synthase/dihydrofolate synthase [Clostridia bacterium]|nr:bifunctional folylpolyglutamate synthase/dihydrofolate synthase [Clostridia bacterium]